MKKIDRLVIKAFLGPFLVTFFIALFVLVMQLLWKYIDDLVGKGLELTVIAELIFYWTTTLVPMALPIAVLLSSIMTFGGLGERYELVAVKAAGISLLRFMAPLIAIAFVIAGIAFAFSNYVLPWSNKKAMVLLASINTQRPAFGIDEGVFYGGIDGYTIRVAEKDSDSGSMRDILIYDHTGDRRESTTVLVADSGRMYTAQQGQLLIFKLYNGKQYEEIEPNLRDEEPLFKQRRTYFKEYELSFDLSSFGFKVIDEGRLRNNYKVMSLAKLKTRLDTMQNQINRQPEVFYRQIKPYLSMKDDSIFTRAGEGHEAVEGGDLLLAYGLDAQDRFRITSRALNEVRNVRTFLSSSESHKRNKKRSVVKASIEYHRKFTIALACVVLFFIGAPLGAIIRKGGMGMPMVVAIIFFIIWHILSEIGRKLADDAVVSPFEGMWMSLFILLPIGIFLSYKAMNDSPIFTSELYSRIWEKISFWQNKKMAKN